MKIAIACSGLGNIRRGYETHASELFKRLKTKTNLDVTLFKGGGEALEKEVVVPNLKRNSILFGGKNSPINWQIRYRMEQRTFFAFLIPKLFKGKYDIIYTPEVPLSRLLFNLKSMWKKTPRLLFMNGAPVSPDFYRKYDFIQQITPYYYEEAVRAGISENKMTIIPHAIDIELFNPKIKSNFREKYGIPEDIFLILSVGAINKSHKRMHWLINEVAKVKKRPYLVIVGEEDEETPFIKTLGKEKLSKNIKFLTIDNREMPQVYRAADLFVLASLIEGLPIVFLEAMASGLPIICCNHPNQKWIVSDAGFFVDMEKEDDLAASIEYLMNDKGKRGELSKKGRERAEKMFSWDKLIPRYVEMFEKVSSLSLEYR